MRIVVLCTLALVLAGCGNKGPLVMASPPAPVEAPVAPQPSVDDATEGQAQPPVAQPAPATPVSGTPVPRAG